MKDKQKKRAAGNPSEEPAAAGTGGQQSEGRGTDGAGGLRITGEMLALHAPVAIAADVVQKIHRHARSNMSAEVCGVLIGEEVGGVTVIDAAIEGEGAAQGGAHVTFTQDTWEHIYSVKDREHPDKRIVGWYHSHPGFGIFLSQQDLFIHENFFSSPAQVAWVYDPHSDEEGCFGWVDGKVKRLREIRVMEVEALDAPVVGEEPDEIPAVEEGSAPSALGGGQGSAEPAKRGASVSKKLLLLLSLAVVFVAGFAGGIFLFPRTLVMYSVPDGRLLTPDEMQAAVERARQRQRELLEQEQAPPEGTPSPDARDGNR